MEDAIEFLKSTYFTILPLAGSALFGYAAYVLKDNRKRDTLRHEQHLKDEKKREEKSYALEQGTLSILRYIIRRLHGEFVMQGYVTEKQLQEYLDYEKAYKGLGGNGIVPKMTEEIMQLPIDNTRSELTIFARMYYDACRKMSEEKEEEVKKSEED